MATIPDLLVENDIHIPDDVRLVEWPGLGDGVYAAYLIPGRVPVDRMFSWDSFLNKNDEVTIKICPTVLESDEQIVAVLAHELHELALLRNHLEIWERLRAEEISRLLSPENPGKNFHCLAWLAGDDAVRKLRGV